MKNLTSLVAFAFVLAIPVVSFAGKNTELKPTLIKADKPALADDFSGKSLGKLWETKKGDWKIADGAIVGNELAADKHAAVLNYKVPNHNSAIRLSFKLGEAKAFHLSYNKTRGHLFRIMVTPERIILRTDKPGKKSKVKPEVLARANKKFDAESWHTLLVEVKGTTVTVKTDNGVVLKGSHDSLDVMKPGYRLILRGKGLKVDDVTVWKAK